METEFVICSWPDCGQIAEVTRRDVLDSTDGPVEHIGTLCVNRHVLFMAEEKWEPDGSEL